MTISTTVFLFSCSPPDANFRLGVLLFIAAQVAEYNEALLNGAVFACLGCGCVVA